MRRLETEDFLVVVEFSFLDTPHRASARWEKTDDRKFKLYHRQVLLSLTARKENRLLFKL
jgi:hypothetical protein